jgi:hypothetical protein
LLSNKSQSCFFRIKRASVFHWDCISVPCNSIIIKIKYSTKFSEKIPANDHSISVRWLGWVINMKLPSSCFLRMNSRGKELTNSVLSSCKLTTHCTPSNFIIFILFNKILGDVSFKNYSASSTGISQCSRHMFFMIDIEGHH